MRLSGIAAAAACACLAITLTACGAGSTGASSSVAASFLSSVSQTSSSSDSDVLDSRTDAPAKEGIAVNETVSNSVGGEHAIVADGTTESYENVKVEKTGDSGSGDEADFYGDNAAVFATNRATLDLSEIVLESNGAHANGVFSYGEGTTVNIVDSVIETAGNCSGGLMTTGGGTMNAENLRIATSGNSSAAIRSDRGGGTVNVSKGAYTTSGTGSPVIYSTADITVSDAELESTASQGVVVEGKNSVALHNVDLIADNNKKNSDKSSFYQAVMIYQSMSGDAASGKSSFTMDGGSLVNANGDVFFVNNTACDIGLDDVAITNNGDGVFLRAAAAGWGSEGKNGGQVSLNATGQAIDGDMIVDSISSLNLRLDGSTFSGAINPDGRAGGVYVELSGGSKWTLAADSHITSLTCAADSIDLNGHALYVGDELYAEGSASAGVAVEAVASEPTDKPAGTPPDGEPSESDGASGDGSGGDSAASTNADAASTDAGSSAGEGNSGGHSKSGNKGSGGSASGGHSKSGDDANRGEKGHSGSGDSSGSKPSKPGSGSGSVSSKSSSVS